MFQSYNWNISFILLPGFTRLYRNIIEFHLGHNSPHNIKDFI